MTSPSTSHPASNHHPLNIQDYLAQHEQKDLLRFLTCGSVDDGKSTLIGRLFYDCHLIYEDQLAALLRDSKTHGTTGGSFDPALFTDGLKAEREQGITIDVAYRYFSTSRRKFIIADCPGHEQYTRNMATGASHCNLAIILVDARNGITTQTRRHSFIVSLLGIRHIVLAVNKMDLVDWNPDVFHSIRIQYSDFASRLQFTDLHAIPISALHGDNVVHRSSNTPWYDGPTLLSHLETVNISADRNLVDFRFPVQLVLRPNLNFRGFAGSIASGILRKGDEVLVVASGQRSRVRQIFLGSSEIPQAQAPLSVTLTLEDEIDVSRGDVLAHPNNLPRYDTDVEAMLVWFDPSPSKTNATYWAKIGTSLVPATITKLRYKTDINSLRKIENPSSPSLEMNEIGRVHISFHRPIAFDPYRKNPPLGAFILIDRLTNATAAAGMILDSATADDRSPLSRSHPASRNIQPENSLVLPTAKAAITKLRPVTLWFTGLSGSGKSTIAKLLERRLTQLGILCALLDGDNLRHGLCRDLGFTPPERSENIRRAAEVARLFNDNGLLAITSFISPYRTDRENARQIIGPDRFLEIYISTPLEICEQRDVKGLYARARAGEIPFFTGISDPYEPPTNPALIIPAHQWSTDESLHRLLLLLRANNVLLHDSPQEPTI